MGIRDILMLVIGYGCVPFALLNPFWGLMAYCWLSFMKPQSLVWSQDVQSSRIAMAVGAALVLRVLFDRGRKWRLTGPSVAFLAFWAWMGVSVLASTHRDMSMLFFEKFCKIGIAVMLLTGLIRERAQLKWLVVLLAACPGLYAVKLGLFLLRGGTSTSHGGPQGLDNNDTALFIAMSIPMLVFAASEIANRWGRRALYASACLAGPAVVATGSRGGLIALAAAGGLTLWRRTCWWKATLILAVAFPLMLLVIPQVTQQRYGTITKYSEDLSVQGRFRAWDVAMAMAAERPMTGVGIGLQTFMAEYDRFKTIPEDVPHVAHSVWFSTLGGMGYVGLALYIALLLSTLWHARRVRRLAVHVGASRGGWAWDYAVMIECTIVTYAIGASFLSQVGFEFIYAVCLLAVPLHALARTELSADAQAPVLLQPKVNQPSPGRGSLMPGPA